MSQARNSTTNGQKSDGNGGAYAPKQNTEADAVTVPPTRVDRWDDLLGESTRRINEIQRKLDTELEATARLGAAIVSGRIREQYPDAESWIVEWDYEGDERFVNGLSIKTGRDDEPYIYLNAFDEEHEILMDRVRASVTADWDEHIEHLVDVDEIRIDKALAQPDLPEA